MKIFTSNDESQKLAEELKQHPLGPRRKITYVDSRKGTGRPVGPTRRAQIQAELEKLNQPLATLFISFCNEKLRGIPALRDVRELARERYVGSQRTIDVRVLVNSDALSAYQNLILGYIPRIRDMVNTASQSELLAAIEEAQNRINAFDVTKVDEVVLTREEFSDLRRELEAESDRAFIGPSGIVKLKRTRTHREWTTFSKKSQHWRRNMIDESPSRPGKQVYRLGI
jgi:hypothetical protein